MQRFQQAEMTIAYFCTAEGVILQLETQVVVANKERFRHCCEVHRRGTSIFTGPSQAIDWSYEHNDRIAWRDPNLRRGADRFSRQPIQPGVAMMGLPEGTLIYLCTRRLTFEKGLMD